ncbi:pantoate--beta-alanine ligase [Sporosarcina sp. Marseille-Q4063]|uniref:pantoate--beta-alanine ligase n=1 Tax=Sporosarcina sp. Marseille-Q4063 TaxID=2810514 RepID=UPI001BB02D91|nr:pantoate--beta-alanine ligase [Sporosarcina sp. Marseille-Q4063]QUW22133.1 pantoate--beta-alanine ligase [Sporosarcina sp. Marseille-Q4063]
MKTIRRINELQELIDRNKRKNQTVGFVPTMGFLHAGHLSLVEQARKENDIVVMSIFVNPAQFGPGEDFEAYPRDEEHDAKLASEAGVDVLFMPNRDEMYPQNGGIQILPGAQAASLCGATRPGHFDGVLKVVLKLFNIVDPDHSYFGMKDAQQLAIIETFVRDFNLRTKIRRVPTIREEDGLAKSSRNVNLSKEERLVAPVIQKALKNGELLFHQGVPVKEIEREVANQITNNSSGLIDYVSLLAYPSLLPYTPKDKEAIIACAVKFEKTRLIDNIIMSTKG